MHLKRLLLLLLFGLLAPAPSIAQHFTFRHYGQNEGLRNLDVFKVIQDKQGLLWIATENGLFRYDGSEFHRFTGADGIQESLVLSLTLDCSGRIWVTTNDHLYYFDGARFQHVPTGSHPMQFGAVQRLATIDPRHVLFLDRGTLMQVQQTLQQSWTAAPYFTPQQTTANPELSQLHSIFVDRNGTLWLGCNHRICRVKNGQLTIVGPEQNVPDESWTYFFLDRYGWLWARSTQHIRVLAPNADRFAARDIANGLSSYAGAGLLTFAEDAHGDLLTQTDTGIARWNGTGWRTFDRSNGLAFDAISTILSDRQGSIWISTRGHGIYRWLGYGQVENWTTDQGLGSNIVWPILRDRQSRIWIADQLQLSQLDDSTKRITVPSALAATGLHHGTGLTQTPDGALWIVHIGGELLRYDPVSQRVTFRAKMPDTARLLQDFAHRIWLLSREGLYVIRHPELNPTVEKITDPLVSIDAFADAAEDPTGSLWFLADNHLYRCLNGHFDEIAVDSRYTRGQMRSIAAAAPDGTLWIGGGLSALLHLRVQGAQATILNAVATPELVSTDVQIVRFDRRGWLWIGTDLGVNVFDGTRWRLLTEQDGLISNDTDEGAFFADPDGSIWIGVNGGAIHLLHPEQLFSPNLLTVQLKSATLGDRVFRLTGSRNVWRWRDVPLDIAFTSLNFDREGSLLFRYRLLGLESEWTQTPGRHLHYAAMPPGDYRFEVQAIDPAQQKQSPIASFTFTIRPPWWRTTLFYVFLALLFTSLSVLVWHLRERQLIRRQQILRKLVAQRTRELEAEKAELLATREELRRQATRDALTGIWNRFAILDVLERELDRARREGTHLAVVLADIDHFKRINDTLGHLAGDAVLRDAAQRMLESVRPYDFVGRYGGEEFLMVLPGLAPQDPCPRLLQLQQTISGTPFLYLDKAITVTSSFGVVWMDSPSTTVEDMIRCADHALYEAKADGRDCIIYYTHPTTNDLPTI